MRLRAHLRSTAGEHGVAMPVAVSVLAIVLTLSGVAAAASIRAVHRSDRDRAGKRAVEAATAGVNVAIRRLNAVAPQPGECVVPGAGGLTTGAADADGWCPPHSEFLGEGESFTVRTSPGEINDIKCQSLHARAIVAVGTSRGVTRRALVNASADAGSIFGDCGVVAWKKYLMEGPGSGSGGPYLRGDVVTNGDASVSKGARLCGDVAAETFAVNNAPPSLYECGTFTPNDPPAPYKLRKVDLPDCIAAARSAGGCDDTERITQGADPLVASGSDPSNVDWDEPGVPERELVLRAQSTLTLTGNYYRFCRVKLQGLGGGSRIYVAPRVPNSVVKIYLEDPANCPGQPDERNLFLQVIEQAAIINMNPDPTTLQIYMVGTDDPGRVYGTRIMLRDQPNDVYTNAVIYAPRSRVTLRNHARLLGAVAAKQVELRDQARLLWSDDVTKLNGANFSVMRTFDIQSWSECPPPPAGSPLTEGCQQ